MALPGKEEFGKLEIAIKPLLAQGTGFGEPMCLETGREQYLQKRQYVMVLSDMQQQLDISASLQSVWGSLGGRGVLNPLKYELDACSLGFCTLCSAERHPQ